MGRLMLGETNRYCSFDRKVRIHDCNGGWSWVLCLLCMADNNTDNRSCNQRHEKTIIRLTDQLRLLDQDMIRLQEKLNTALKIKENEQNKKSK